MLIISPLLGYIFKFQRSSFFILSFIIVWGFSSLSVQGQSLFGPFEADSHTTLLMHFNGTLEDASAPRTANSYGKTSYIENSQLPGDFGQQIQFHNQRSDRDSHLRFPDHNDFDLRYTWTIQTWFNIFRTAGGSDHRKDPRLLIKPGDPFYQSNYYMYLRTSNGRFMTGHFENTGSASWRQVTSPDNTVEPGRWYHLTYIRDSTSNMLVQILHTIDTEGNPKLVNFQTLEFNPDEHSPAATNDKPLRIGKGGGQNSRLDGFMDELHISKTVRKYDIPGLIQKVQPRRSQSPSDPITFQARVPTPQSINVDSVMVYYSINDQQFQKLTLPHSEGDLYKNRIFPPQEGAEIRYYMRAWTDYGMDARSPYVYPRADWKYYRFNVEQPTDIEPAGSDKPQAIKLAPNHPNPFNPSTRIRFSLPKATHAKLKVYTVTGKLIQTLVNDRKPAGLHSIQFSGDNLSSGLYIYVLEAGGQKRVGKMTLMK